MKKLYAFVCLFAAFAVANAQTVNYDLENWTANAGYDDPVGWLTANPFAGQVNIPPPVEKISVSPAQGLYSAKMTTYECQACVFLVGIDTLPGFIRQEVDYYATPGSVSFMYQYDGLGTDWGGVVFETRAWDPVGDTAKVLAQALDTISGTNGWQMRTVPFISTGVMGTPDTLAGSFTSSIGPIADAGMGGSSTMTFPAPREGANLTIDAISFDIQTGVEEQLSEADFSFLQFPNNITINTDVQEKVFYDVFNIEGKQIKTGVFNKSLELNTANFNAGVYIISLNTLKGKVVKRIYLD